MVAVPDPNEVDSKMEAMEQRLKTLEASHKNFDVIDDRIQTIRKDIEELHKKATDMEMIKEDFGDKLAKKLVEIEVTGEQRYGIQENNIKSIIDGATTKFNDLEQDLKKMTQDLKDII